MDLDSIWDSATAFFSWIPWTWQTMAFFAFIACLLLGMTVWEWRAPGGGARRGVLTIETTRGDRLFISLLGSAYIHLAWLGLFGMPLWGALGVSILFTVAVFRWV